MQIPIKTVFFTLTALLIPQAFGQVVIDRAYEPDAEGNYVPSSTGTTGCLDPGTYEDLVGNSFAPGAEQGMLDGWLDEIEAIDPGLVQAFEALGGEIGYIDDPSSGLAGTNDGRDIVINIGAMVNSDTAATIAHEMRHTTAHPAPEGCPGGAGGMGPCEHADNYCEDFDFLLFLMENRQIAHGSETEPYPSQSDDCRALAGVITKYTSLGYECIAAGGSPPSCDLTGGLTVLPCWGYLPPAPPW